MNSKSTKRALISSAIALIVCISMLIGTTFAWFTDNVSSSSNIIKSGNLDVQLFHDDGDGEEEVTSSTNNLFDKVALWEPGAMAWEKLTVKNNGSLALKYRLSLTFSNSELVDVLKVAVLNTVPTRDNIINSQLKDLTDFVVKSDAPLLKEKSESVYIAIYWAPSAIDNDYKNKSINIGVNLAATQLNEEVDGFDSTYDMFAEYSEGGNSNPTINVGGAAELKTALEGLNTTGTIILTQDIDLTGVAWDSPNMVYTGSSESITIDGQGHTIKNLTSTNNPYGGVIGRLNTNGNVIIKNINLENITISGTNVDGEGSGGALNGWMDCHGNSITVENITVNRVNVSDFKYIGGLIGYRNPDCPMNINNCTISNVVANSTYNESGNYKGHIGGVVGYYGNGTITNCTLDTATLTGSTTGKRIGAFIGSAAADCVVGAGNVVKSVTVNGEAASADNLIGSVDQRTDKTTNIKIQ